MAYQQPFLRDRHARGPAFVLRIGTPFGTPPMPAPFIAGCTLDDVITNVPGPTTELGRRQLLGLDLFPAFVIVDLFVLLSAKTGNFDALTGQEAVTVPLASELPPLLTGSRVQD